MEVVGHDLNAEEEEVTDCVVGVKAGCMEGVDGAVKAKDANAIEPAVAAMDGMIFKTSHPSMLEGSKQDRRAESVTAGNPLQRMKEKVLKDVTNKLESDPISLKPAWSGLQVGGSSGVKESMVSKSKAILFKAQLVA